MKMVNLICASVSCGIAVYFGLEGESTISAVNSVAFIWNIGAAFINK